MALLASCSGGVRDPLLTYFSADHRVSVRYPASWRAEQATADGIWRRTFTPPAAASSPGKSVTVTLLAGALEGDIDDYARRYLVGERVTSSRDEERQGVKGRAFEASSPDGAARSVLLLFKDGADVLGLHAEGDSGAFSRSEPLLRTMEESFTFEKVEAYHVFQDPRFRVAIRVPPSWPETRRFSAGKSLMAQFTSPALIADKGGQTAHASLTLTVEPVDPDTTLDSFYNDTRIKIGSAFEVLSHKSWRDGYADLLSAETPLTVSRVKRFYRISGGRGYSLAFEARDDVLPRASRWCDLIAGTLQVGAEAPQ
jgi:hypothetical protein